MVAWFLIAIATLIIFAFVAVNSVQSLAMASDAGGRIETVKRLDTVASALVARAASPNNDGMIYLPVGENNPSGGGYGLPSYLGFQTQTPFGQRFVYCPFGDASGSGTTLSIPNADGSSYAVATATFEDRDYVVGGRPSYPGLSGQPNLMGFVMAPRSKLAASPSCSDVIYNSSTRKFEAPDAIVRPLTRENGVDESRTIDARQITYYVSPTGTGTGASSADPASFATAMNFYKSRHPAFMTINMAAGNYGMGAADLNTSGNKTYKGSTLQIKGVAGGTFIDAAPSTQIHLSGDLSLEGVYFDSDVLLAIASENRLRMIDSSVGRMVVSGQAVLSGTNSITYSDTGFALVLNTGGHFITKNTLSFYTPDGAGVFLHPGSKFSAEAGRVVFSTGTGAAYRRGIYTAESEVLLRSVSLEFPEGVDYGMYIRGGSARLFNTLMQFGGATSNNAIFARESALISVQSSTIGAGTPPSRALNLPGAALVGGENTTVYAALACWNGDQFRESALGTTGNVSTVLGDVAVPGLPPSPTNSEIQAHVEAQATNARRQSARLTNDTVWACNP